MRVNESLIDRIWTPLFTARQLQCKDELPEAQEGEIVDCPECDGSGCEHCDYKGYHDAYTDASTVKVEDHLTDKEDGKISPKSKSLPSFYKKKKVIFAI